MKTKQLITAFLGVILSACNHPNPLNEDEIWSLTIHTCEWYDMYSGDTNLGVLVRQAAALYEPFDLSLIDTMIQIPDTPWYRETFHLSTGEVIEPIHIYTYDKGYVLIDNLREDRYHVLRFTKGTRKGDIYDWIDIERSQAGSVIYDTLFHWGLYY